MSAIKAAEEVLREAGEPLRCEEIARRALASGLWQSSGKTPEATIHAQLAVDIQRLGLQSKFQRTAKAVFGLREWGLPEYVRAKSAKRGSSNADAVPSETQPSPQMPNGLPPERIGRAATDRRVGGMMSFTDAAEQVLANDDSRHPLHYRTITQKVLAQGLVNTTGKTPEATLYAQVLTETKRKAKRGEQPRFVMHGKGYVGLAKWMGQGLAFQIEQHNQTVRKKLYERIRAMDPGAFEELIGELLGSLGFEEVIVTARSGDGGIDVRGTLVVGEVIRTRMAVQVKRWKQNIQAPIVQQVRGSLGTHEQGLIITTSDFGKGAREEAARANAVPVGLMNGEQLVGLLMENDLGVSRRSHDLFELAE